jgi:hypothetical protein
LSHQQLWEADPGGTRVKVLGNVFSLFKGKLFEGEKQGWISQRGKSHVPPGGSKYSSSLNSQIYVIFIYG